MDAVIAARIQSTRPDAVARLDEAAFSAFYAKTSRAVWAYVYRVTGNAADADDIVQEAFCRLLRVGPEAAEEEWRRYLYKIASNLVVDRWRQSKRQQQDEPAPVFAAPPQSGRGDDEDVARTFAKLTSRERALLWLAYVEEESHEEIAASLGLGRRSIKVLLFRARLRLRDLLKSQGLIARA